MRNFLVCVVVILVHIGPAMAADSVHVKFSLSSARDAPPSKGAESLSSDLAANKVMQLDLLPAGAIGRPSDVADKVRARVIDMALVPVDSLTKFNPGFAIFALPFAFGDLGAAARFQQSVEGQKLLQSLESAGLKGLAYWPIGMDQLVADRSVRGAGDLKGLKVANTGSALARSVFETLGASAPTMAGAELMAALETGVVDAAEIGLTGPAQLTMAKRAKYLNYTNQRYRGSVLIANLQFWNSLSNEVRQTTLTAIKRISSEVDRLAAEQTASQIATLRSDGVELIIPEASAFKSWRDIAAKTWLASGGDRQLLAVAGGAEGGGDPCGPGQCRCPARTCSADCCRR